MVALQTEKDNDAPQKEVQELQRVMEPKRVRTHADTADDDEECDKQSSDDWDLPYYCREDTRIQNRLSTPLGSRAEVSTPQEGKSGALDHSRLGLVGWIAYWSLGKNRLSTPLVSRTEVSTPQEGKSGVLDHSRLGLVGWIAYWSLGNCALAVKIIVGLIRKLNLTENVFETLTPIGTKHEVETNAKIVILMKAGLAETKHCRTEQ